MLKATSRQEFSLFSLLLKLELDDSYFTLEVTQHAPGDFLSALESKQRALDIRDYSGKTPRHTSALRLSRRNTKCLRQFLVSTSVRSARSYSFTIKMKDFSLHFNVSLQKLD